MVLNYYGVKMTPDGVYRFMPPKGPKEFTRIGELMQASRSNGVPNSYKKFVSRDEALSNLRASLDDGRPIICLVKYEPWLRMTGNSFKWGHFVVATGYDDEHIMMNDPLFGLWVKPASKGDHYSMPIDQFCAGWGGFPITENPNWACVMFDKGAPQPVETISPNPPVQPEPPSAEPEPTPRPEPEPEPKPAPPRPQFGDVKYNEHVVVAGESLSALAQRYYGNPGSWRLIQSFNGLTREHIWVGETLRIPRLSEDALLSFAVSFDTTLSEESQEEAFNYDDVGSYTFGIGFLDDSEGADN
jgi:hypothetical protein